MPVRVDSRGLQKRLRDFVVYLPYIANQSVVDMARFTMDRVQSNVRSTWQDHNQVGFDLDNFIRLIEPLYATLDGVGAMDTDVMGTMADLDKIKGVPGMWHQGTRQGDKFGLFLNQVGMFFDQVQELKDRRDARWGSREPQWWLIENGTLGTGAYAPQPPKLTINNTLVSSAPRAFATFADTATRLLRQRGILG